jgi:flagellar protein FlaG
LAKLERAWSEQVATVHPSPPSAVSSSKQISAPATRDDPEQVKAAAKQIEAYLKSVGRELEFRVDDDTGRTVITVRDVESGEVIRQIPGDETLRLARLLGAYSQALIDLAV